MIAFLDRKIEERLNSVTDTEIEAFLESSGYKGMEGDREFAKDLLGCRRTRGYRALAGACRWFSNPRKSVRQLIYEGRNPSAEQDASTGLAVILLIGMFFPMFLQAVSDNPELKIALAWPIIVFCVALLGLLAWVTYTSREKFESERP